MTATSELDIHPMRSASTVVLAGEELQADRDDTTAVVPLEERTAEELLTDLECLNVRCLGLTVAQRRALLVKFTNAAAHLEWVGVEFPAEMVGK